MLSTNNIPQDWKDVLSRVQSAFPGAIIAGGALRDLSHGKSIKDVDIFIPIEQGMSDREYRNSLGYHHGDLSVHIMNAATKKNCDRMIFAVYHLIWHGVEYELIFASPKACNICTFDINICQIRFDGKDVYETLDCVAGMMHKEIRFVNPQSTKRTNERADRIKVNYPEYKIIIPETTGEKNGY